MNKSYLNNFLYFITNLFLASFWLLNTYGQFLYFLDSFKLSVLLMSLCQGVVGVLFFIRKNPKTISKNIFETILSFLGTFMILFYRPNLSSETLFGEIFISFGAMLLFYSLLSLNTSFGIIPANRKIKTTGMYSFVRHPIYMSYMIFFIGYCINNPIIQNIIVITIAVILECFRMLLEERHLSKDLEYIAYMKKVKFRLIPYVF